MLPTPVKFSIGSFYYKTTNMKLPLLTIVIPCYNENEVLPETNRRMVELVGSLVAAGKVAPMPNQAH